MLLRFYWFLFKSSPFFFCLLIYFFLTPLFIFNYLQYILSNIHLTPSHLYNYPNIIKMYINRWKLTSITNILIGLNFKESYLVSEMWYMHHNSFFFNQLAQFYSTFYLGAEFPCGPIIRYQNSHQSGLILFVFVLVPHNIKWARWVALQLTINY